MTPKDLCPLCNSVSESFYRDNFLICTGCSGIFRPRKFLLTPEDEKTRYSLHNNDANDIRYQHFVSPITDAVLKGHQPGHSGLDFGSGSGSAIAKVLNDKNYNISQYDPYFRNYPELLEKKYDYIVCCETIEHLYEPAKEFKLFKKILLPSGRLYCMTLPYSPDINFGDWYYKNDPTHVFLYQKETFEWIKNNFGFSSLAINHRLITFNY